MPKLLIVGGGLFGSLAARYARARGIETLVFDPGLEGAASPAAAGLFKEAWAGRKLQEHYQQAVSVLEQLVGIRTVQLRHDDGTPESFLCVPPTLVLEEQPLRQRVTAVGDGWLEADNQRYEGWVYVAAGIWCELFCPGLGVYGKAGAAFTFVGEHAGRIRVLDRSRQAMAFVRDVGFTHFSDGTAERDYTSEHDRQTVAHATSLGLIEPPVRRLWGQRPYVPGGAVFRKLGRRTWLATGGRKMGTILGASFARRLVDRELRE